jgi:hypothetical protein
VAERYGFHGSSHNAQLYRIHLLNAPFFSDRRDIKEADDFRHVALGSFASASTWVL